MAGLMREYLRSSPVLPFKLLPNNWAEKARWYQPVVGACPKSIQFAATALKKLQFVAPVSRLSTWRDQGQQGMEV